MHKRLILFVIVLFALVGALSLASCKSDSGLEGAAVSDQPIEPVEPVLPAPTKEGEGVVEPTQEDIVRPVEVVTGGVTADNPAVTDAADKAALLDADVDAQIADIVEEDPAAVLTMDEIEEKVQSADCPECVDEFVRVAEVTQAFVTSGLAESVTDRSVQMTATLLAGGSPVAATEAGAWIRGLKDLVTGTVKDLPAVGSRDDVPAPAPVSGGPDTRVADMRAQAAMLDQEVDTKIATAIRDSIEKTLTYDDIVVVVGPDCPECLPELEAVRDMTQQLLDMSDVAPIKDARARGTALAFVAGQKVSNPDLADWIENLKSYLGTLK